ncbi:hypothetical protein YK48G_04070 [Lentilactobacillus fungorum]|uniref:DUF4355 domain-containing protein n=1 Tax=Lentilactobacillus fungorum TaxID=2201250 RepID=A0ABQ3VVS1_9LACO|nr:DUF4355 domain-containing protein [Lentilactobacillus fungorum]GHP12982.1 hypothetical protein YK48G_04070 [Lentilactobacillus fungorum]
MKTNLQFFADPSNDPEPTDPKPTPNDPAQDPKDPKPSGKTYTQDDIGKMMAAKAKEVESNLKDDFQKELEQKKQEWLEKGEKRAGMNANEKAQADLDEQRQALKDQQDRLQKKLDEADRKDALAATKTALTDQHIPAEFAEFISDVKEEVRNNNLDKFTGLFNKAVQEAVEKRVTGKQSPQNGGQQFSTALTQADFAKMSLEEQTNLYRQNPDLYNKLK